MTLLFAAALLHGRFKINTNLFDILPVSSSLKNISKADAVLGEKTSRGFYILVESREFADAKKAAELFYQKCISASVSDDLFDDISLYIDDNVTAQVLDYLYQYRYALLDSGTINLLETGGAEIIAEEGIANAFSIFNIVPLDNIETDPFFLTGRHAVRFLSKVLQQGGSMSPRENVLSAVYGGKHYVMIRGAFSKDGVSLTSNENAVGEIYDFAGQIKKQLRDVDFIYSGVPFHVYESSQNAQSEISIISSLSMLAVILIFLFVFRDFIPILFSFTSISLSIAAGTAAVLLFFSEIHILTFVFGTTLIGICVDYALHYFVIRLRTAESGNIIRRHIFRALLLCFASTEIAFTALFFAPFTLLKQFSVFLFFGAANSFLTAICIFPLLPASRAIKKVNETSAEKTIHLNFFARVSILSVFAVLFSTVLFINRKNIRIENNISDLYTMSGRLKESEKKANAALNYGASGSYFIVEGENAEDVLIKESWLINRLDESIKNGVLSSYMAASVFMPPLETQKKSISASEKLVPFAEKQLAYLGFTDTAAFMSDFNLNERNYIEFEDIPSYLQDIVSNLWLGEIDGRYYTCVLPLHVKDEAILRGLAGENSAVHFINKARIISAELDALTRTMLQFFAAAFAVVSVILFICYRLKNTIKILLSVLFAISSVLATLSFFNVPFGFFPAAAIILIFGLGVDYMIFSIDSSCMRESFFAVKLSWITTELSFGALALSSFTPVHIFGLTVFSGLFAVFISVVLLNSRNFV
ncbi:MAG: hypothetical protein LBC27_04245, partial [Spirochaetaceae bacterium]|nr:hypothetical protein [Spirochaetaceae bacterium]